MKADIPLADQIEELQREHSLRAKLYPNWVAHKKMSHATAQRHMLRLEAAIATLQDLQAKRSMELRDADGRAAAHP